MELISQFVAINTDNEELYDNGNILKITFFDESKKKNITLIGRILNMEKEIFTFNGSRKYEDNDIYTIKFSNVINVTFVSKK